MSTMEQMPVQGKYQPYPEYKDSGVEWVGDMPHHWQTKPAFAVVMDQCIKNSDGAESNVLSLSYGNIVERDVENNFGLLPESFNTYQIVNQGDIVLRLTDLQNDKRSLRVGRSTLRGIITSAYLKLACGKELDNRYAYRLLHSYDTTKVFYGMGGGLRQSMKFEDFRRLPFLLPPLEEQCTIAAFLDYETTRIDKLIAQQQRLIELLKEKRQAVISHAVTKGLNPDAPMKDSGVEWLGEVPEHWDVTRAKFLLKFITSGSRGWAEFYSDEGELFFRITNLTRDTIRPKLDSIQFVLPPAGAEGVRSRIRLGDLLVSITADLGSVCVADSSINGGYVSQHVALIRPNTRVTSSDWLGYFILSDSSKEQLLGSGYGGTKIQLSLSDMRDLWVAFPPNEEQNEISVFLLDRIEHFETLMNRAQRQISLQQERRTALISAAVTGKIDLRGWTQPKEVKA
ncbi:restriction endonuclease subunit S [Raoultella ornithinolytica]|uniref:restriction endonuclease subunit S n=1 Tax=Raoultella ornithinolytica TaxID=54291 RepID=UPI0038B2AA63